MLAAAAVLCAVLGWDMRRQDRFARLPREFNAEKVLAKGLLAVMPAATVIYPENVRIKTKKKLDQAGIGWEPQEFLAVKILLGLAGTAAGLFAAGLLGGEFLWTAVLVGIGYFLPDLVLDHKAKKRQECISRAMPDFGMFFATALEAGGGNVQTALNLSAARFGGEIGKEVAKAAQEVMAGARLSDALQNMADRCGVEEMQRLIDTVIQASKYGTPIGQAVKEYAAQTRLLRRLEAEKKAGEAAVKMVFPMLVFIVMPLLVMLAYPAIEQLKRTLAG
ncbi:MAG: type II secretion system F family protein [Syntrophothermus sp.]|uniref:type II secretion system F family protein n=1 Tax=Syntrophothermus sp. TaxID=2736299 RepID=UPI00257C59EF|nr:type II secretion system F family protein [Syntrophothermus sp.]NSW83605.1 type II secretion system F family protein [Syntrophothermus sp.]